MASSRTFWDFDDAFTGPVHGFAGADDYYARSSSIHFLPRIVVPTLLYSAVDDPFLPSVVLDRVMELAGRNPHLVPEFTSRGGHVGWVSGTPWAPTYHMGSRVAHWLENGTRPANFSDSNSQQFFEYPRLSHAAAEYHDGACYSLETGKVEFLDEPLAR